MSDVRIPRRLCEAAGAHPDWRRWVDALPSRLERLAEEWKLELDQPYAEGGTSAWTAPVLGPQREKLVLKVGWRHFEAEHEAEGLRVWDGDGAVRCLAARRFDDAVALLIERCVPGRLMKLVLPEPEQDLVIAGLLRRLWARRPAAGDSFLSLEALCAFWAAGWAKELEAGPPQVGVATRLEKLDPTLEREALCLLEELPASADRRVLLCTDLHAENVLSAEREPWLAIDPKPFVGDPAFDPVQHMLNCAERLASDPRSMAERLANLLDLDAERVRLWLFVRCAQEGRTDPRLREAARRLAA